MEPRLREVVDALSTGGGRACFVLDAEYRLAWVSEELCDFLGVHDTTTLGIGNHFLSAMLNPAWRNSVTPDSMRRLAGEVILPYLDAAELPAEVRVSLPPRVRALLGVGGTPPAPPPPVRTGCVEYLQPDLPPSPIDFIATALREDTGDLLGTMVLMYLRLRPNLVALLGRGDVAMYERMARLMQPERRSTAILFADLQASGELSRQLPTAAYFALIRALTARFDALVGEHLGIVGKHAGDGWTAFVLAQHIGGASKAVAGCLAIAQRLRAEAADRSMVHGLANELPSSLPIQINFGVHWGPNVYLGQLVPGGRLEVTALGDEVNECARIQQCAQGGTLLASKPALELLDAADTGRLGIDLTRLAYRPLASMDTASDKARRDAGQIAVAALDAKPERSVPG